MPVTIEICEEGYVLLQRSTAPLTLKEIGDSFTATRLHRNSVQHTVHALIDMSSMGQQPLGILRLRISPSFTHPRSGMAVFAGASYVMRSLVALSAYLGGSRNKVQFFDRLEDAWLFLRKMIAEEKKLIV